MKACRTGLALGACLLGANAWGQSPTFEVLQAVARDDRLELVFVAPLAPGRYAVSRSSNLSQPSWALVSEAAVTSLGGGRFLARLPKPSESAAFYRVLSLDSAPDLVGWFGALSFPTNLVAGLGGVGSASLVILNQGNEPARAMPALPVRVVARPLSGQADVPLLSWQHPLQTPLEPGRFQTLLFHLAFPTNLPAGDYRIAALIDEPGGTAESREDNNEAVDFVTRRVAPPFVDLFARIKLLSLGASIRAGDDGAAALSLGNLGNVPAFGMVDVEVWATTNMAPGSADILLGRIADYPVVLPPQKATDLKLSVHFPIDLDADAYHLVARVIPRAELGDTNASNNTHTDPDLHSLSQDFNLEDFRQFNVAGASWDYESSVSTSFSGGFGAAGLDDFGIQTVRVEGGVSNLTRVVVSQAGKDVGAMGWQAAEDGTRLTTKAAFGAGTAYEFSIENLVVAPPSFNPKSGRVFLGECAFSAWVTNWESGIKYVFRADGETRSALRLHGYEDVLLQSGLRYEKALKFELSISSTSTLSLVIEGEPVPLAGYVVNDAQTSWAASGMGVVKSVSQGLVAVHRSEGPPEAALVSSAFMELAQPDARLAQALDGVALAWLTPTLVGWKAQTNVTHDGVDAARSAPLLDDQRTAMQTRVTGPGELSFWWKVSCEPQYDFVQFSLDGREKARLSGSVDWTRGAVFVPEGRHALEWTYSKDTETSAGYDAAWVDQVVFVPDLGPPWLQTEPQGVRVIEGDPVELEAVARGLAPLSYQWERDGVPLLGATNARLAIPKAQVTDAGAYRVRIANGLGATNSLPAVVQISPAVSFGAALDTPDLPWSSTGPAPWIGQTEVSHDGVDAARSGYFEGAGPAALLTTVTGPGMLSFWWKTECAGDSYLEFRMDGTMQQRIEGASGWQQRSYFIDGGPRNLEWFYWQGDPAADSEGFGWVDQVVFVPDAGPPVFLAHPQSLVVTQGATAVLSAAVRGQWPFAWQWVKDGSDLSGATNSSLTLSNALGADAGRYQVRVSNAAGWVMSSNAEVRVVWACALAEAVNAPSLPWTTGGAQAWQCQTNVSRDGIAAARSGGISHSQSTWLETVVTGPGLLTFWWKVSSEAGFDLLSAVVDGATELQTSGDPGWQPASLPIPAGTHAVRWVYDKDNDVSVGEDAAWVDEVNFQPETLSPNKALNP